MPSRNLDRWYDYTAFGQTVRVSELKLDSSWYHSPRVGNKLRLQANPFAREIGRVLTFNPSEASGMALLPASASTPSSLLGTVGLDRLYQEALVSSYARFRGKIYKGSGSLGLTIATYSQSANMIRSRSQKLLGRGENWERVFRSHRTNGRKFAKALAGYHLEVIFGWMPLVADMVAACSTIIQDANPPTWVSAQAKFQGNATFKRGQFWKEMHTANFAGHVKRSGAVRVSNPNVWLAERAGLLNGAAVAWDAVPWSFLVNQIVNTGQLVNAITDFVGLSIENGSTTRSAYYHDQVIALFEAGSDVRTFGSASYHASEKYTTVGAVDIPPVTFKLPGVNWGTASMLSSLMVQKFLKVNSLTGR